MLPQALMLAATSITLPPDLPESSADDDVLQAAAASAIAASAAGSTTDRRCIKDLLSRNEARSTQRGAPPSSLCNSIMKPVVNCDKRVLTTVTETDSLITVRTE